MDGHKRTPLCPSVPSHVRLLVHMASKEIHLLFLSLLPHPPIPPISTCCGQRAAAAGAEASGGAGRGRRLGHVRRARLRGDSNESSASDVDGGSGSCAARHGGKQRDDDMSVWVWIIALGRVGKTHWTGPDSCPFGDLNGRKSESVWVAALEMHLPISAKHSKHKF